MNWRERKAPLFFILSLVLVALIGCRDDAPTPTPQTTIEADATQEFEETEDINENEPVPAPTSITQVEPNVSSTYTQGLRSSSPIQLASPAPSLLDTYALTETHGVMLLLDISQSLYPGHKPVGQERAHSVSMCPKEQQQNARANIVEFLSSYMYQYHGENNADKVYIGSSVFPVNSGGASIFDREKVFDLVEASELGEVLERHKGLSSSIHPVEPLNALGFADVLSVTVNFMLDADYIDNPTVVLITDGYFGSELDPDKRVEEYDALKDVVGNALDSNSKLNIVIVILDCDFDKTTIKNSRGELISIDGQSKENGLWNGDIDKWRRLNDGDLPIDVEDRFHIIDLNRLNMKSDSFLRELLVTKPFMKLLPYGGNKNNSYGWGWLTDRGFFRQESFIDGAVVTDKTIPLSPEVARVMLDTVFVPKDTVQNMIVNFGETPSRLTPNRAVGHWGQSYTYDIPYSSADCEPWNRLRPASRNIHGSIVWWQTMYPSIEIKFDKDPPASTKNLEEISFAVSMQGYLDRIDNGRDMISNLSNCYDLQWGFIETSEKGISVGNVIETSKRVGELAEVTLSNIDYLPTFDDNRKIEIYGQVVKKSDVESSQGAIANIKRTVSLEFSPKLINGILRLCPELDSDEEDANCSVSIPISFALPEYYGMTFSEADSPLIYLLTPVQREDMPVKHEGDEFPRSNSLDDLNNTSPLSKWVAKLESRNIIGYNDRVEVRNHVAYTSNVQNNLSIFAPSFEIDRDVFWDDDEFIYTHFMVIWDEIQVWQPLLCEVRQAELQCEYLEE